MWPICQDKIGQPSARQAQALRDSAMTPTLGSKRRLTAIAVSKQLKSACRDNDRARHPAPRSSAEDRVVWRKARCVRSGHAATHRLDAIRRHAHCRHADGPSAFAFWPKHALDDGEPRSIGRQNAACGPAQARKSSLTRMTLA